MDCALGTVQWGIVPDTHLHCTQVQVCTGLRSSAGVPGRRVCLERSWFELGQEKADLAQPLKLSAKVFLRPSNSPPQVATQALVCVHIVDLPAKQAIFSPVRAHCE